MTTCFLGNSRIGNMDGDVNEHGGIETRDGVVEYVNEGHMCYYFVSDILKGTYVDFCPNENINEFCYLNISNGDAKEVKVDVGTSDRTIIRVQNTENEERDLNDLDYDMEERDKDVQEVLNKVNDSNNEANIASTKGTNMGRPMGNEQNEVKS
ncbi:hypothetical protein GH714_040803 [Hevea brasiliensis]|uniref:Uncharacterized protein n=1 Tax=Hevea brasiliensis TaxID=3981 RepID=A0A6A6MUB9_HEVBR|nr:hypothetical protein GH714_040803 [Hevea brasiliensis]